MRHSPGEGRCCLAVMADTACDITGVPRGTLDHPSGSLPSKELAEVFGLPNYEKNGSPSFNFILGGIQATLHNDGRGGSEAVVEKTHTEIAAMIREEYLKPSEI